MPPAGPRVVPRRPDASRYCSALIHAPAGAGKTRLLGTAQEDPRTYPMAFLNFEAGDTSLAGLDIDVFDIRDGADYDDVFKQLKHPQAPWKSVGVDSLTETQITMLLEILGKDTINRADPDQLAQQDWGLVLTRMRRIVRQYVKLLPMHVFMTALSKEEVVPRIGTVKAPAMQGSFGNELPGIMDVVAYLAQENVTDEHGKETGEVQRILLLHSYPRFSVKCRTPWNTTVEPEIVDPTITKLLDTIGFTS